MTYSHRFPRFLKWLTLHDNFMHTSVSFSTCHIWASKLCLVSSCWLLIFVANLDSSASACTLKRVVNFHPLLMRASLVQCDGHFVLIMKQGSYSCFPEACYAIWEPEKGCMTCPHPGTNMHFIKFHIPKWTTAIPANVTSTTYWTWFHAFLHANHPTQYCWMVCIVRWLYLCACCSCMCTSRSFSTWKPKKLWSHKTRVNLGSAGSNLKCRKQFEAQEVIEIVEASKCVWRSILLVLLWFHRWLCFLLDSQQEWPYTCRASFGLWLASSTCSLLSYILSHFVVQPLIRLELL